MTTDDRASSDRPLVDLGAYQRAIQRRWATVLVIAVVAGALGYLARSSGAETYESTAVVKVNNGLISIVSGSGTAPNMPTEQQVARSTSTTALAAEKLGTGLTAIEFQRRATAERAADASTLALTFQAPTPEGAQSGASAWAEAYLQSRRAGFVRSLELTRRQLQDSVAPLEEQYTQALAAAAAAEPGSDASDRADATVAEINSRLAPVRGQLEALNSIVVDPGQVLSPPVLPSTAEGLPVAIYIAAGVLIGLLLGAVVAILVERRYGRVREAQDVRATLRVPAWGVEPRRDRSDPLDPALEAVAARLPAEWHTLVVTDLGQSTSVAVADRLAEALRAYGRVEVVAPRQLAHLETGTRRLVAVRDVDSPEAAAAMARADGVVLVVETGVRLSRLARAHRSMSDIDTELVAAVVTSGSSGIAPRVESRSASTQSGRGRPQPGRAGPPSTNKGTTSAKTPPTTDGDPRRADTNPSATQKLGLAAPTASRSAGSARSPVPRSAQRRRRRR